MRDPMGERDYDTGVATKGGEGGKIALLTSKNIYIVEKCNDSIVFKCLIIYLYTVFI